MIKEIRKKVTEYWNLKTTKPPQLNICDFLIYDANKNVVAICFISIPTLCQIYKCLPMSRICGLKVISIVDNVVTTYVDKFGKVLSKKIVSKFENKM